VRFHFRHLPNPGDSPSRCQPHQAAVTRDMGGEERGELSFDGGHANQPKDS
jgi:hypothetical protein